MKDNQLRYAVGCSAIWFVFCIVACIAIPLACQPIWTPNMAD